MLVLERSPPSETANRHQLVKRRLHAFKIYVKDNDE